LLKYYIDNDERLNKFYISIFNINGAHGKVYFPLIKLLKIPALIITDIDIKRAKCEKDEKHSKKENCEICGQKAKTKNKEFEAGSQQLSYKQVETLVGKFTTNATIKSFNRSNKLDHIDYFKDENLYLIFQKNPINGFYATSLEEALILNNFENVMLNETIKKCIPRIYTQIVGKGNDVDYNCLKSNSYKLQKKLSDKKSEFSNTLLFKSIVAEGQDAINLPSYIQDGFNWLANTLSNSRGI